MNTYILARPSDTPDAWDVDGWYMRCHILRRFRDVLGTAWVEVRIGDRTWLTSSDNVLHLVELEVAE